MSNLVTDRSNVDWMTEFLNEAIKAFPEESSISSFLGDLEALRNDVDVGSWTVRLIKIFSTIRHSHELTFMLSSLCRSTLGVRLTQEIYFVIDAYEILHPLVYARALNFMVCIYDTIFYCKDRSLVSSNVLNLIMRLYDAVKHKINLIHRLERFWSVGFICGSDKRLEFFLEMRESLDQGAYDKLVFLVDDYFQSVYKGILPEENRVLTIRKMAADCLGNNAYLTDKLMRFLTGGDERFFHPRGYNLPLVLLDSPLGNIEEQSPSRETVNPNAEELQTPVKNLSKRRIYRPILGKKIEKIKEKQPSDWESSQESENFWGEWKNFSCGESFETDDKADHLNTSRELAETESRFITKEQDSICRESKSYAAAAKTQVPVKDGGCSTRKDNTCQVGSIEKVKRKENTEQSDVTRRLKVENKPDISPTPNQEETRTEFLVRGLARNTEEELKERMPSDKQGFDVETEPRKKTDDNRGDICKESLFEYGSNTEVKEITRDSRDGGELKVKVTSGEDSDNSEEEKKSCEEPIVECDSKVEKVTEVKSVALSSEIGGSKDETEFNRKKYTGDSEEVRVESNVNKSSLEAEKVHDDKAEDKCDKSWTKIKRKPKKMKNKSIDCGKHYLKPGVKPSPTKDKEKYTGQTSGIRASKSERQMINKEKNAGEPSDTEEAPIKTESKIDYTGDQKKDLETFVVKDYQEVINTGQQSELKIKSQMIKEEKNAGEPSDMEEKFKIESQMIKEKSTGDPSDMEEEFKIESQMIKEEKNAGEPSDMEEEFKIESQIIKEEKITGETSDMEETKIKMESKTGVKNWWSILTNTFGRKKTCGELKVEDKHDAGSIGKKEVTKDAFSKKETKVETNSGLDSPDNTTKVRKKNKKKKKKCGGVKDEEIIVQECSAEKVNEVRKTETNLTEEIPCDNKTVAEELLIAPRYSYLRSILDVLYALNVVYILISIIIGYFSPMSIMNEKRNSNDDVNS